MLPTKYPKSLITIIKLKISNFDRKIRAETSSMNLVHIRQILRACNFKCPKIGRLESDPGTRYSIPKLGIGTDSENDGNRYLKSSNFAPFLTKSGQKFEQIMSCQISKIGIFMLFQNNFLKT